MNKNNIQPWLDYFDMLRTYEEKELLNVLADKHEAYMTLPAFLSLCPSFSLHSSRFQRESLDLLRRIRAYAAWRSTVGTEYMTYHFALHLVKDEQPYDLLCTILLTPRRRWFSLRRLLGMKEKVDIITY